MTWQRYDTGPIPAGLEVERRTPARAPSLEADVLVPLAQALATAGLVAAVAWLLWRHLGWPDPQTAALATGAVALVGTWLILLVQGRSLLWDVRWASPGEPPPVQGEPPAPEVRVELAEPGARRVRYLNLPGDPDRLAALARGVLDGKPLSEATWTGAGQPFSRSEFGAVRAELLRAGLVRWRNPDAPAQGVELTGAGRAVMRRLGGQDNP